MTHRETGCLAGVAGSIDAIGVLSLDGLFVSHMSGNSAALGAAFGEGRWAAGLPHLYAIPVFVVGLFLGYLWVGPQADRRRFAALLLGEALLIFLFAAALWITGGLPTGTPGYFLLATLPLLAMGLQNAAPRSTAFPTTYVTGILDRMGKAAALWIHARGTPDAAARRIEVGRAISIWLCYVAGALAGSAGLLVHLPVILLAPLSILVGMAIVLFCQPPPPRENGDHANP